jgi:hypothetical protein
MRPRHQQQIWDGTPLHGRVLIRCYHGLGDTLQFIRYAPLVRARSAEVVVWAQPALLPLLGTVAGISRVLPLHDGDPGVACDVDVEIMELPFVFRTTLDTIPAAVPYLDAGPRQPATDERLRVGVMWRAGDWNSARSIPFDLVRMWLDVPGIRWQSLQHPARLDEADSRLELCPVDNIWRLARAMCALDLVISVDTMSAHLAGALGLPAWTLLPRQPDWRWLHNRTDTPWYPTMRLFRQSRSGWTAMAGDVRDALNALTDDAHRA